MGPPREPSGCAAGRVGRRRHSGGNELSRLRGSERSAAWADDVGRDDLGAPSTCRGTPEGAPVRRIHTAETLFFAPGGQPCQTESSSSTSPGTGLPWTCASHRRTRLREPYDYYILGGNEFRLRRGFRRGENARTAQKRRGAGAPTRTAPKRISRAVLVFHFKRG